MDYWLNIGGNCFSIVYWKNSCLHESGRGTVSGLFNLSGAGDMMKQKYSSSCHDPSSHLFGKIRSAAITVVVTQVRAKNIL